MKTLTALIAIASVAGIGYYVGKKILDKKNEETKAYTEVKEESAGEKVRKASMFAVGTIKTTADKIAEGINQVKTDDMVKKGEETMDQVKDSASNLKNGIGNEINNLKNLVTSINKNQDGEDDSADEIQIPDQDSVMVPDDDEFDSAAIPGFDSDASLFEDAGIATETEDNM